MRQGCAYQTWMRVSEGMTCSGQQGSVGADMSTHTHVYRDTHACIHMYIEKHTVIGIYFVAK